MTVTTPNMDLVLPSVSSTPGPEWATLLNAAFNIIDAHDHSADSGVKITPSGINISSDLEFNDNDATELRTTRYTNNTVFTPSVNDVCCLYAKSDNLYYIDGQGNIIQLTLNGAIDFSGSITSLTLNDSAFFLQYFGDTTKKIQFSAVNITPSTTRTFSLPEPGSNDTLVTNNSTSIMTNKALKDSTTTIVNNSDTSKALSFTLSAATTTTSTSIAVSQTANRVITLPDATDTLVGKATTDQLSNKSFITTTTIRTQNLLTFNNSANTFGTSLRAGTNLANVTFSLPITDGSANQVLITDGSGQLGWATAASTVGNVTANDSNVAFTNADNRHQICLPTAPRTYSLPTTSIPSGDTWDFDNRSAFLITLNSSGGNLVGYVPAFSQQRVEAVVSTPTTAANWNFPTSNTHFDHTDVTKQILLTASGNTTGIITTIASTSSVARTITLPNATDTLVGKATTDTLTNKTLTGNTAVNLISGSGTFILNTTGTTTIQNGTGSIPIQSYAAVATTTTINQMVNTQSEAVFTGSTATALNGIAAGFLGQQITVVNGSTGNITVTHNSGTAASGDAILLPSASSFILGPSSTGRSTATFTYGTSGATNFWYLTSTNVAHEILGSISGIAPVAGFIGEQLISVVSTPASLPTSTQYGDATSLSLTAGIWDVYANCTFFTNGATMTNFCIMGISSTSGNSSTGLTTGLNQCVVSIVDATGSKYQTGTLPAYRVAISATTTYYLKVLGNYSAGTPQFFSCGLRATRVG